MDNAAVISGATRGVMEERQALWRLAQSCACQATPPAQQWPKVCRITRRCCLQQLLQDPEHEQRCSVKTLTTLIR